jgi:hypothetical protein
MTDKYFRQLTAQDKEILARIPDLPDSAKIPTKVAAAHEGCSVRSILRHYRVIKAGPRKNLVRLGDLRSA